MDSSNSAIIGDQGSDEREAHPRSEVEPPTKTQSPDGPSINNLSNLACTITSTRLEAGLHGEHCPVDSLTAPELEAGLQKPEEGFPSVSLSQKESLLKSILGQSGRIIIAYSGGVDSSLLAYYARLVLGENARIVIAVSPSLANSELLAAREQAQQFNWQLIEINTDEVEKEEYQRNDAMRCYFCKSTLFAALSAIADKLEIRRIAYGANVDDLKDFRPGHKAAREYNVMSPLQLAGLRKEEIRTLAGNAGLPSFDRPQSACLSSRFPTFQAVTPKALFQVEAAEDYLHSLGFKQVRVRHHDDLARIEIDWQEIPELFNDRSLFPKIAYELKRLGYKYVSLDLEGYRQGSANRLG